MECGPPFVLLPKASHMIEVGLIYTDTHKKTHAKINMIFFADTEMPKNRAGNSKAGAEEN